MMRVRGIYVIRNAANGKVYVGSAKIVSERWAYHRRALRGGYHHSYKLQRAWAKYGAGAFDFALVETVAEASLLKREQFWLDQTGAARHGYNICPIAGTSLGAKQSKETRAKLIGRVPTTLTRERMAAAQRGRKHTEATRAKIGNAHRGKVVSAETRKRLSEASRNISPETRARLSAAARNRTPEHKARIAAAMIGKTHGPEARAKVAAAVRGRVVTAETRARMSVAAKAAIERRRAA